MIKLSNVEKSYKDFKLNISMEIPAGRVTGLIGKNGAGKSTTLKLILGLIKADGGTLTVIGKDINDFAIDDKQLLGVALAEAGFSSILDAKDIASILKKMYRSFDEKMFFSKCEKFKLPVNKKISEFSTGMKAKLRVLIAMSHEAKLLILDEPTAGLDVEARNEILDMLREYLALDDENTILITSHISSDLEGLCDDVYLIDEGRILLHEDTDEILSSYGIIKVDDTVYDSLDKQYLLKTQKMGYGYACLTDKKDFYLENYRDISIEKGNIDDLILFMTGGYR